MAYTRQTKSSKAYSSHHGRVHSEWVPTRASQLRHASRGGAPINSVSVGHIVVGGSSKINHVGGDKIDIRKHCSGCAR